ncbi:MAG: dTMP kinase [Clostridiales bacterium]|nr:dTMP kinase [Clostridiales bacterium]
MKKGLFITVEGGDGSGKTTQLAFIREYLAGKGEDVLFTREPGGTPVGEKIRTLILDPDNEGMDPMTETLLYAASRAQLVSEVIRPALEAGQTVVCDRYVDSSIAYQGYARGLGDSVTAVNGYAIGDCVPDATILIKVDPAKSRARIDEASMDRMEQESAAFHRRVYEGYLALEKQYPARIIGIDGEQPIEAVSEEIARHLDRLLFRKHGL